MNLEQSIQKLFSLHQFGVKLGLDNITRLLDQIGNPHRKLKSVHIAGSNGKGSTSSFIASILTEAGYKTGLYTSPHFVRFNERIRINGTEIDNDYIVDFMNGLEKYIENNSPTFFELTTAMAFKYFAESNIDFMVLETGLGGRLDATNVVESLASVITSISLEHTNILGNELEKIAFEKGGIIKNNSKVFLANLPCAAENVLMDIGDKRKCELFRLQDHLSVEESYLSLRLTDYNFNIYSTPLPGKHQLYNSALAVLALNKTLGLTDVKSIANGITNVISNSGIQGRYERFNLHPMIIFDSAHNPEGINVFLEEFKNEYKNYKERVLITGIKGDKDAELMLKELGNYFDKIFVTTFENERAYSISELLNIADKLNISAVKCDDPVRLIEEFRSGSPGNCLVVLGSMYLLGNIKERIKFEKSLDIFNQ